MNFKFNTIVRNCFICALLAFFLLILFSEFINIPKSVVSNSYSPSIINLSFDIKPRQTGKLSLEINYSFLNREGKTIYSIKKIDQSLLSDQYRTILEKLPLKEQGRLNSFSIIFKNINSYEIKKVALGSIDITKDISKHSIFSNSLRLKQVGNEIIEISCDGYKSNIALKNEFINLQKFEYVNISQNYFSCQFYKLVDNLKGFKSVYYLLLGSLIAGIFITRSKFNFKLSFFIFSILISVMYFRTLSNNTFFYSRFEFLYAIFYFQIPIILTFSILLYLIIKLNNILLRSFGVLFYLILSFIIVSDVFSFTMFSKRLVLEDILTYGKDALNSIDILLSFIKKKTVLFILSVILFILPFIKSKSVIRSSKTKELFLSILVICFTCLLLPKPPSILTQSYFENVANSIAVSLKTNEKYSKSYKYINYVPKITEVEGRNERKNVIVIMVESLSAIDSKLLCNNKDYLPNLDKISREGIYFNNYYSNGISTDLGNFSFLTGYPNINGLNLLNPKFYQNSVVKHFSKFGYRTKMFHSDVNVGYVENIWKLADFDEYYDGTDSFYKNSERLTFGSVPDGDLFNNVLNKLQNSPKDEPYFAYIMTSTSHAPFIVPKTHEESYEGVMRYVDKEISNFYQRLKQMRFFDHGMLVITGDHRSMTPYTNHEKNIYGEIGFAKVPLIIIGDDTYKDYKETNLSHISLGVMLEQINLQSFSYNDLNYIPNLTDNGVIVVQKAYPTDEVLIKYKEIEYVLKMNSDKTAIYNSSEEASLLNEKILPEITWIRK